MKIKGKLQNPPLLSWDIYASHLSKQAQYFNRETEISILKNYKKKFSWSIDVEKTLNNNDFEAIVLTNLNQEICWVNKGFTKMTGYPANFAQGKKPNFLQGKASFERTRKSFRGHLKNERPFEEEIVNYKKDGKPYNCKIEVYPLKNINNIIVHFLALEKEIKTY